MATRKQKKAIAILSENVGMPISKAMEQAGYTKITAATPKRLTESKGFKALAERIPDDLLEKVHLEGLQAKQFRYSPEGELIQLDDFAVRHKYMDSAYKLKGSYAPEKSISVNMEVAPSTELKELADEILQRQRNS